jgi:hypothetical protein
MPVIIAKELPAPTNLNRLAEERTKETSGPIAPKPGQEDDKPKMKDINMPEPQPIPKEGNKKKDIGDAAANEEKVDEDEDKDEDEGPESGEEENDGSSKDEAIEVLDATDDGR